MLDQPILLIAVRPQNENFSDQKQISGYSTTITPFTEDSKYWYVLETSGKNALDALRYSKTDFDFMGEK